MKLKTSFYILAVLPTFAWSADIYLAKVTSITDGDTIKVLRNGNEQVKIRLSGIDCPELSQAWGTHAKQAVSNLVAGKTVTIEVMDLDRYGRTVARVFAENININRALVEAGHCWTYVKYAKDTKLFTLQEEARLENRGLWRLSEGESVPPWEWRKNKRKK